MLAFLFPYCKIQHCLWRELKLKNTSLILEAWFECKYSWKKSCSSVCVSQVWKSWWWIWLFSLKKLLGEVPAQISLLAYVKPEQKTLFTQELLPERSNISIAAGHNVQINTNIQVFNHCQGMAKVLQQTGACVVFFLSSSHRMMSSPQELLTRRRRTRSRRLKFQPVINLPRNDLAGFLLPRVVGLKTQIFLPSRQGTVNLKGKRFQCLEFMVLVIK